MSEAFEIAGRCSLHIQGLGEQEQARLRRALDPCPPAQPPTSPDVVIDADPSVPGVLLDIQRDAGDGRTTATDGRRFYVIEQGRACAVPPLDGPAPATFAVQPGFPIARAFGRLVRPTLQLSMLARGCAAVHSAAVAIDGRAVLVAGWSESGKTETALALVETGARFLSDKWTVVSDDGTASVFPIGVGVRGWVLRFLPQLDAALGRRARRRLKAAAIGRAATRPLARGVAAGTRGRLLTLADRTALRPSELRRLYGDDPGAAWSAPLEAIALLTTTPPGDPVRCTRADPSWAAARLALTASFERRGIFELHDRAQWSAGEPDLDLRRRLIQRERTFLENALSSVRVIEVKAPFPTDPRPVAKAITRLL